MRVGAAYTQTGVLAKGRAKGSAGEIEERGSNSIVSVPPESRHARALFSISAPPIKGDETKLPSSFYPLSKVRGECRRTFKLFDFHPLEFVCLKLHSGEGAKPLLSLSFI